MRSGQGRSWSGAVTPCLNRRWCDPGGWCLTSSPACRCLHVAAMGAFGCDLRLSPKVPAFSGGLRRTWPCRCTRNPACRPRPVTVAFGLSIPFLLQSPFSPPVCHGFLGTADPSASLPPRPSPHGQPVVTCTAATGLAGSPPPSSSMPASTKCPCGSGPVLVPPNRPRRSSATRVFPPWLPWTGAPGVERASRSAELKRLSTAHWMFGLTARTSGQHPGGKSMPMPDLPSRGSRRTASPRGCPCEQLTTSIPVWILVPIPACPYGNAVN